MAYILRVMGVVFLLSCLAAHQIFRQGPCLSIETTVCPSGENSLIWNPTGPGDYFLYLRCNAGSVSQEIRENFMNWQIGPKADWAASLTILTNRNLCFSQNSLTLKPAIKSGNDLYFLIGRFELMGGSGRVEVKLSPREPPPFGNTASALSIRPGEVYLKELYTRNVLWLVADLLSILISIFVAIDYVVLRRPRARISQVT